MLQINVSVADATVATKETLTAGRVGLECQFGFSAEWDDLAKVAVFDGAEARDVAMTDGDTVTVPWECLASAGYTLRVGVYGMNAEGTIVIPTVWAKVGKILDAAAPTEQDSQEPSPELAAQLLQAAANALAIAQGVRADADAGAFIGPQGPRGEPGEKGDKGNKGDLGTYIIPATYANDTLTCTANYGEAAAAILNGQVPVLRVTISDGDGQVLDLVHSWQRPSGLLPEIHFAGEDEEGQKVDAWVSPTAGWNLDKQPLVSWGEIQGDLNDQTDLQNALNAKYDFQEDGIPVEDLDADAQETLGKVDSKAGLLRDTASGDIVSIVPDATVPKLLGLTAAINPVQDLHGYDHPWPGGGGVNQYNAEAVTPRTHSGVTITVNNGTITFNGTATANAFFSIGDSELPSGDYIFSFNNPVANSGVHVSFRNTEGQYFNDAPADAVNKTVRLQDKEPKSIVIYVSRGTALNNFVVKPQLESGSTATAFAPYSNLCPITGWTGATIHVSPTTSGGTTYSVTFPTAAGTVYGGTLDVVNGVLTVTHGFVTISDFSNPTSGTSAGGLHWADTSTSFGATLSGNSWCSMLTRKDGNSGWAARSPCYAINSNGSVRIYLTETTKAAMESAYADLEIVYPLATPQTYQLTPQEVIKTLLGTNNVWADTGDVTVEYAADLKTYIDSKIAAAVAALS